MKRQHSLGFHLLVFLVVAGMWLVGCRGHGHRKFTLDLPAGQTIVITDEVLLDEDGKRDYSMTFEPAVLNWLFKPADEPAEPSVTATTVDGGG